MTLLTFSSANLLSFECTVEKGGLLILQGGGATRAGLLPTTKVPEYMYKHHRSWYAFARAQGLLLEPDDITLIRSTVKASGWTVVAFTDTDDCHGQTFRLETQNGSVERLGVSTALSYQRSTAVQYRTNARVRLPVVGTSAILYIFMLTTVL